MTKKTNTNSSNNIIIKGAREHNLKNVNTEIPRDKLTVITGLSGSGKSSLAFDTIYAEGQRRYVESLSTYARQFLEMQEKPDIDSIEGLSPAISIEQKTTSKNPRSTVGTVTEIYDYLRLLFARIGVPYSPATGLPIESMSVSSIVDAILEEANNEKAYILAPIVRGRKGEYRKQIADVGKKGFSRIKVDNKIYEVDNVPLLDKKIKHTIEVVVDRIKINENIKDRLAQSVEVALEISDGLVVLESKDEPNKTKLFSSKFACPESGFTIEEIEPRMFSFNSPYGACPTCNGIGREFGFTENMIINKKLSLTKGAIIPWTNSSNKMYSETIEGLIKHFKIDEEDTWEELSSEIKKGILYGINEEISFVYSDNNMKYDVKKPFLGIIPFLEQKMREASNLAVIKSLKQYQEEKKCYSCGGYRLKKETLAIKINKKHIGQVAELTIVQCLDWFSNLKGNISAQHFFIAEKVIKEITNRLTFLVNVGLDYLSISRSAGTLSGGESQRIRLASQIGSGLTGVLYVLDEPSIGLHQRDNAKLIDTLKALRDKKNTVIVVEHDEEAILAADYLIDMGLGAGSEGGEIIAEGTPEKVFKNKDSITAKYITGKEKIEIPKKLRSGNGRFIELIGASQNNLQDVDLKIPLGTLTCITGVSGSGKSTLIIETLQKVLSNTLMKAQTFPGKYKKIRGTGNLNKIIDINQSPIGRTPRSNPATYTGAFTAIRDWYTNLPESKARGYTSSRFSFNVKGGRCENCQGDGLLKIEMHFLSDIYVPCDVCNGERYNRETLEVKYKDKSISDVLKMSVNEAYEMFKNIPLIAEKMQTLKEVGLGYIKVGQPATTLSGGEAQRIKLSKELSKKATGRTLYILDEPTTGLHFADVKKLLEVLHKLVDAGNSVLIIEHNLDVVKTADHVVDIGPGGGDKGGKIVAQGTPQEIAKVKNNYTGAFLKKMFN